MTLRVLILLVCLVAIAAAVTLALTGNSAQEAWGLAAASLGVLVGQHLDKPAA